MQTRTSPHRRLGRRDRPDRGPRRARLAAAAAAPPWTRPRPPRAPATRTRTSPRSRCASSSRTPRATAPRTARCCSRTATRLCTRATSKDLGTGGEASPRLFDLDGDNALDTVLADSSGELRVLHARRHAAVDLQQRAAGAHAPVPERAPRRGVLRLRGPAARGAAHARDRRHRRRHGARDRRLRPASTCTPGRPTARSWRASRCGSIPRSRGPQDRTRNNHIKRGFTASPALGDLNEDGDLEIVVPALDQHVYVWDGNGNPMPGLPEEAAAIPAFPARRSSRPPRSAT